MNYRYKKSHRLLRRNDYKEIFQKGSHFVGKYVVFEFLSKSGLSPKLGLTASKKFGKAHERNRFKRISREAFRLTKGDLSQNLRLNLRPRMLAKKAKTQDIIREIQVFSQTYYECISREVIIKH